VTIGAAVTLTFACGATAEEAGDIFDITWQTAKTYIAQARKEYRDRGIDAGTKVALLRVIENEYQTKESTE